MNRAWCSCIDKSSIYLPSREPSYKADAAEQGQHILQHFCMTIDKINTMNVCYAFGNLGIELCAHNYIVDIYNILFELW